MALLNTSIRSNLKIYIIPEIYSCSYAYKYSLRVYWPYLLFYMLADETMANAGCLQATAEIVSLWGEATTATGKCT